MRKLFMGKFEECAKRIVDLKRRNLPKELPEAVRSGLCLNTQMMSNVSVRDETDSYLMQIQKQRLPSSKSLFENEGKMLSCWLEEDLKDSDDWLISDDYYPIYYFIIRKLAKGHGCLRMLEIGVRTGYIGVVLARATEGNAMYYGVDPNIYVKNGMVLASSSLRNMRQFYPKFNYAMIEGYSWEANVQNMINYNGPFNVIHIDGDHTLLGKLFDLEFARRLLDKNGIVMVDDYDHHAAVVQDAVNRAYTLGWYSDISYVRTKRGLALLQI